MKKTIKNNDKKANANGITYKFNKHICALSETNEKGWRKEVNIITWGDNKPKYDIRDWNFDHSRMSKGITLDESEFKALAKYILNACK